MHSKMLPSFTTLSFLWGAIALLTSATPLEPAIVKRQLGTATVSLAAPSGTPAHLASGFIYGIPDNGTAISTQIPDSFYTDIKFNYCRAGGAQLPAPSRGWIYGVVEYDGRFASALSNYRTTRKFGGRFILLVHDLWGADSTQSSGAVFPGDNGDWTSYDAFLTRLISNLTSNHVLTGLELDIWNEPDGSNFWPRTSDQWTQMWGRAVHRLRSELPGTLISGPSISKPIDAGLTNPWWTKFGSFIASNGSIPDTYSWHNLDSSSDLATTLPRITAWRALYGLPDRPKNVNEYGTPNEQVPSSAVWYISRFERYNVQGLRANWASAYELHDYMGNLLGKPNAGTGSYLPSGEGYWPAGEWQVYKYYATSMTGNRLATTGSNDNLFDVYATRDSAANTVKIVAGTRGTTGTYDITITGLSAIGLSGTVSINTLRFDYNGKYGEVGAPVSLGVVAHPITNDQVTFWVTPATTATAYAFEFV